MIHFNSRKTIELHIDAMSIAIHIYLFIFSEFVLTVYESPLDLNLFLTNLYTYS